MTEFNRYKSNPDEKIRQAMKGFESGTGISAQEFKEITTSLMRPPSRWAAATGSWLSIWPV